MQNVLKFKQQEFRRGRSLLMFFLLALLSVGCTTKGMHIDRPIAEEKPIPVFGKPELIIIDAGHGGKDSGTVSNRFDYEEKHLTLSTAHMIKGYLNALGYKTLMTRQNDTFVPLAQRAGIANAANASLFVSIHYNSSPSETAEGIEVFYYKEGEQDRVEASKELGNEILSRVVRHTGGSSRGVKSANFAVIRETAMPAILIEGGFLTNPEERKKLKDPQYRRFMAWGIAKGIDEYCQAHRE